MSEELAQKILSFFLWRPSNVPKLFSDYYREDQYWENIKGLEPPRTPVHLHRFENIDPLPRIKRTQAEVKRTLTPGIVPHHQLYWKRVNPDRRYHFEDLTGPHSLTIVPAGNYPVFTPAGPGPWENQYKHCKVSEQTPTTNNPYSQAIPFGEPQTSVKGITWE